MPSAPTKPLSQCPHCGYRWEARKANPKRCPGPRCGKWLDTSRKETK